MRVATVHFPGIVLALAVLGACQFPPLGIFPRLGRAEKVLPDARFLK